MRNPKVADRYRHVKQKSDSKILIALFFERMRSRRNQSILTGRSGLSSRTPGPSKHIETALMSTPTPAAFLRSAATAGSPLTYGRKAAAPLKAAIKQIAAFSPFRE